MSDYTPSQAYAVKDGLLTGDPDKLVLGVDLDVDLVALQTAIATKYDSSDIATKVQAEAGTSNAVLMTPLRVAELLADSGGSGAGIIGDLILLTDPGADRILFWDDSVNATAFLTVGTTLLITGTTLDVAAASLDHDLLLNFVANKHIDHTSVTITAGSGLSYSIGGTDISASATIDLDINGLTVEGTLDLALDHVAFFDASATANRKVTLDSLVGIALGDGKWFRTGNQAMSAGVDLTVAFNTADYDVLTRGTFSIVTGEYTAGSDGARILYSVVVRIDTIKDDETLLMKVQVDGVDKATNTNYNAGNTFTSTDRTITLHTTLNLSANEVVRTRVNKNVTADAVIAGIANSFVSIVELG